jgi:hypothetical protein
MSANFISGHPNMKNFSFKMDSSPLSPVSPASSTTGIPIFVDTSSSQFQMSNGTILMEIKKEPMYSPASSPANCISPDSSHFQTIKGEAISPNQVYTQVRWLKASLYRKY